MARPGDGFGFWVRGIEPAEDLAYRIAGPSGRRRFWSAVADFGRRRYELERRMGIGVDGGSLAALSPVTIANRRSAGTPNPDPNAPPFIPGYDLSRTISLLRAQVTDDGVWFTWARDPVSGLPWGQVLHWHATGQTSAPVRNVIGLSPAGVEAVRAQAARWWKFRRVQVAGRSLAAQVAPPRATVLRLEPPTPPPVNLDLFTFGSGTRADYERRLAAGTTTGFRQIRAGDGPRGLARLRGGPGTPPPAPRTPRTPAPPSGPPTRAVVPLARRGIDRRAPRRAESLAELVRLVEARRSEEGG